MSVTANGTPRRKSRGSKEGLEVRNGEIVERRLLAGGVSRGELGARGENGERGDQEQSDGDEQGAQRRFLLGPHVRFIYRNENFPL